jgi:hypothetical protein
MALNIQELQEVGKVGADITVVAGVDQTIEVLGLGNVATGL